MAGPVDLSTRISALERAVERAKGLPKAELLTAMPMAELVGTSWPTLRDWCNVRVPELEARKCFERGDRGTKFRFKPLLTCKVLLEHFRKEGETARVRNLAVRRKIGVSLPASEETASLDDVRKLIGLTMDLQKSKMDQGLYVPVATLVSFLDGYNRSVIEGIMGVRTEADPTGRWSPDVAEAFDDGLRSVAARVHARTETFIEEYRARAEQAGTGVSG